MTFDDNELGVPYSQSASEVIENALTLQKQSSPSRKTVTPRSKTPGNAIFAAISSAIFVF